MARIEAQDRPIQLTLPKSSTVYVFTRQQEAGARASDAFVHLDKPPLFEQSLIDSIVQDRLDRGPEEMDGNGHLARFESRLRILKTQGVPYQKVVSNIYTAIGEIRLEGRKLGSRHPVLNEMETTLISLAEEIITEPTPTRP